MLRLTLTTCAPLALAGCTLGPDYKRPDVTAPAAFQYEPKDAAATADTPWWQQFQDPVLEQLINEALAHNTNIQIAAANVEQAAAFLTQTRSQLFPHGRLRRRRPARAHARAGLRVADPATIRTRPRPTRPRCRPAGRSTCGAASAASRRPPMPTCWPPTRRGAA